ncbi:MAG: homocysteine S-methyltransferase family protein, partial [Clostridia bacterium]|nr:homocysteine S-methyltransferase family protein [Clostridia bacterium]
MKTNNPFEIIKDRAVLFDGAMGTMLEKYGIEPGELPETWNMSHPEVIRSIHEAYLDAGADVITANTFGCSPLKYDGETLGKLVAAGLSCARDAADESERKTGRRAFVALDVGPTGRMLSPLGDLDFEDAVRAFSDVVRLGEKYGADLVLIETMSDSYETKAAALAAKESCSLPVFVTNVYDE